MHKKMFVKNTEPREQPYIDVSFYLNSNWISEFQTWIKAKLGFTKPNYAWKLIRIYREQGTP